MRYTRPLEERKNDRDVHDLGFIFMSTYQRWYQADTRTCAERMLCCRRGRTLSQHFNEKGQYLRSFVAEESMFIDIMMNVGMIFYAARECNDQTSA